MIERLVRGSAARPFLAVTLALVASVLGTIAFQDLPRDVFPDLSAPIFNVIVQNPAMASEELEASIAIPFETALAGLPGTRRVRSVNQLGVSQITVEFDPDVDYFRARQFVAERVQQASNSLPLGTEPPLISSLSGRLNEIMELTLEADAGAMDLMGLRDLAELEIRNRLLAVPGVGAVERLGGFLRQLVVEVDPERMVARGVSLDEVMHALEGANSNSSGGFVSSGPMEWTVRAIGRAQDAADVGGVVVAMRGGVPVLLSDVADIREAPAIRRGLAHRLAGEIVSVRITKQFGADTVRVATDLRAAIRELRGALPRGVRLEVAYDQSTLVEESLSGVGRAVSIGALFVVLVILVLLGDVRAALVVTCTLPLSIAIAGLLLRQAGVGLNTMTLGGLAIAVGLLVDASIIVVENVVHRITRATDPASRKAIAIDAAVEVGRPIAFATAIVVAVFLPLFGMRGIEGRMYSPLSIAVIASMLASLGLALTLTPVVSALVLRPPAEGAGHGRIVRWLEARYAPALDACMRHAGLVRVVALGITIPAIALAATAGSDFVPELDEGALILQTMLPAESSLEEVDRLNHRVEDVLRRFPEVVDVVRRTGRSERTEDPMPHTLSDVLVVLRPDRHRSLDELTDAMRDAVADVPGVNALFTTPLGMRIDEGLGGTPADLTVKIFGPDLDVLATQGEKARAIASRIRGLSDLRVERVTGLPQLRIEVDRAALARVGLTPGDAIRAVRIGMVGEEVSEILRGPRRFEMVVRLDEEHRSDANAIRSLLLDQHDGRRVMLGQVARVEPTFGPAAIRREAGSRRVAVEASVVGRDLGSTADELRRALARELELPRGYFLEVGGRVESQERANRSLAFAIAVAVLAVFVLLYLALDSLADTFVILATLPDAFVGGIVALVLAGETWNVSSLVGLIGLFGIAVQNGLVLVTQTRGLVASGLPFDEALRTACIGRVRPKVMTAATAILGLLPLVVLDMRGTEVERPLAIVMIGGLLTSTAFTLLALPTFYAFVHHLRERRSLRAQGGAGTSTEAASASAEAVPSEPTKPPA